MRSNTEGDSGNASADETQTDRHSEERLLRGLLDQLLCRRSFRADSGAVAYGLGVLVAEIFWGALSFGLLWFIVGRIWAFI